MVVQQILHQVCRLTLRHVLWVAVSPLQKCRIRMTQQVSCNLFAGSLLQQVRSVIMPQRVQMILFRKAILGIQLAQMSGECVRVWHMTVQIGEAEGNDNEEEEEEDEDGFTI